MVATWAITDAITGPGAEGHVGERVSAAGIFRQETLRPEEFGVGKVLRVPVQDVRHQQGCRPGGDLVAICGNNETLWQRCPRFSPAPATYE